MSFQLLAQVLHGVLQPYFPLLQEPIECIPVETEECRKLMLGEPVGAKSLHRHVFKRGTRRILPGRDHLLSKVVRKLNGELHSCRVASDGITRAPRLCSVIQPIEGAAAAHETDPGAASASESKPISYINSLMKLCATAGSMCSGRPTIGPAARTGSALCSGNRSVRS